MMGRPRKHTEIVWQRDGRVGIKLTQGHVAIIDEEDLPLVQNYGWHVQRAGQACYAQTKLPGIHKSISMHRLLMAPLPGCCVDHIDGNGLHNWRANLRLADYVENAANQGLSRNNTTGYKGVSLMADGRYRAFIRVDGRQLPLGKHPNAELAAKIYDTAARHYYGEFARLNFEEAT